MSTRRSPRSIVLIGAAAVVSVVLLVAFTLVVQQAQTRSKHRRDYQQLTGRIMVSAETEKHPAASPRSVSVAQR